MVNPGISQVHAARIAVAESRVDTVDPGALLSARVTSVRAASEHPRAGRQGFAGRRVAQVEHDGGCGMEAHSAWLLAEMRGSFGAPALA